MDATACMDSMDQTQWVSELHGLMNQNQNGLYRLQSMVSMASNDAQQVHGAYAAADYSHDSQGMQS